MSGTPWYWIENSDKLDTPALVVYPERVKENIQGAIRMTGDPTRLRPHVKTHKSPAVTRLFLAAGVRQFKCATIAEGEMLAMEGAPDILLAYQPIGPKAARLAALIRKYPTSQFSCLIDHPDATAAMAEIYAATGITVPVYLDLNVGMDRTGITPGPAALELYKQAAWLEGVNPVGLHAYDGHIRDADLGLREQKCEAAFAGVLALQKEILALRRGEGGVAQAVNDFPIIAGGSPTFSVHCRRPLVQCSPGTFVYWDKGYADSYDDQPFLGAALVVTRVVSLRGDTRLCLDLGHKSIAAENELSRRVFFLNGPDLQPVGQSEEHLVVEAGPGHGYTVGDLFYGFPFHICPTVALYERAYTIEEKKVTGDWKNQARDRVITI